MTKEKAIKVIRKMLAYTDLSVRANLTADMVDACHLAIKALEQETILDKISSEIKEMTPTYHNLDWSITDLVPISEVLKLVDKYKAESENP